jgi:hypothetical protein
VQQNGSFVGLSAIGLFISTLTDVLVGALAHSRFAMKNIQSRESQCTPTR